MENPFFSVVVTVYNVEKYLNELIQSVINQTYQDYELILVDDGSTDASGKICEQYAGYNKVSIFHTENQGGIEARYYGIRRSKGEYVIVIDADDRMPAQSLQIIKDATEKSGSDMIIGGMRTFGKYKEEVMCTLDAGKLYSQKEIMYMCIMDTNHSLCFKAIRGSIIREKCTCSLEHMSINTDYAVIVPILCGISNAYVIDDILYEYRIYDTSVSHFTSVKKVIDTGKVTEFAEKEIKRNNLFDSDIEKAIYVSYLKMISMRIMWLFLNKSIAKEDCETIYQQNAYIKSEKYEQKKQFDIIPYYILRVFRKKRYWVFQMLLWVKKLKHLLK